MDAPRSALALELAQDDRMWKQLWSATKGLAGSKKFQAAAIAGVLWAGGKLGLHLTTEELAPIVGPLWLYVFGQGLADLGKSAALINAAPAPAADAAAK